jgi:hypothetical protein
VIDLAKSKSGRLAVRAMLVLAFVLALTPTSGAMAGFAATLETQSFDSEDLRRIRGVLENKKVSQTLAAMGYEQAEIEARLAQLGESEIRSLAGQLDAAMVPAGDGTALCIIAAVVILLGILAYKITMAFTELM